MRKIAIALCFMSGSLFAVILPFGVDSSVIDAQLATKANATGDNLSTNFAANAGIATTASVAQVAADLATETANRISADNTKADATNTYTISETDLAIQNWTQAFVTNPVVQTVAEATSSNVVSGSGIKAMAPLNVIAYGAMGDDAIDDTAAIQAALNAATNVSPSTVTIPNGVYLINAPLIIYSDTTLQCSDGATIRLATNSLCNMVHNANYKSTSNRDSNIKIVGGHWDRQNNHGIGNAKHSIFLRHLDGIEIRDFEHVSTAGKYAINLTDVTDFHVQSCHFNTYSDGVHIDGPATNGLIENITGTTGDDSVAITSSTYASYADGATGGSIDNVTIRHVKTTSFHRAVLVMGSASGVPDGHNVTRINVSDVDSDVPVDKIAVFCRGTGDGSTERMGPVNISRIRGGRVLLSHPNMIDIAIDDIDCPNAYGEPLAIAVQAASPDGTNSVVKVQSLNVMNCNIDNRILVTSVTNFVIGTFVIADSTFTGFKIIPTEANSSSIGKIRIINCVAQNDTEKLFQISNIPVGDFLITGSTITPQNNGYAIVCGGSKGVFSRLTLNNTKYIGRGLSAAILEDAKTSLIGNIHIDNCVFSNGQYVIQHATAGSGARNVFVSDTVVTNSSSFLYENGTDVKLNYSGVKMYTTGESIWVTNGTFFTSGTGWTQGTNVTIKADGSTSYRVRAWDFPVSVAKLTPEAGDYCLNTVTNGGGVGPNIYNGTNWIRLY